MKISDLASGQYNLTLSLRKGEEIKTKGKIVYSKDGQKHFIARCSPKRSFAPDTIVVRYRKIATVSK